MKYSIKKALGIIAAALIFSTVTVPLSDYDYAVNYTEAIKESEAGVNDAEKILNDVLLCMSETVKEPNFGTNFGEWSVISLARGSFYSRDDKYFSDYYDRISEAVNITAASVNRSGALHKSKSAENSRLILALSAIGRSPENVGGWNLIEHYEDFSWIKNQGINGPAYALIALDSLDYHTSDPTIRQQCIDFILEKQFDDGGWALSGKNADPDITAIVLQSLAPYMSDDNVYQAAVRGIDRLSQMQKRLKETQRFYQEFSENTGKLEIRELPLYYVAERFPSVASFGEYRDKVLRFLNVENEDILSSMVRTLTFDETGYKGSEMYVVKPAGKVEHEKQNVYLEHGKCLYTTLLADNNDT